MSSLLIKSSSSNIHHRLSSSRLQSEKRQQQQKQQQFGLDKNASDFKLKKIIEKDDDNNNIVLYPSLSSLPLTSSTTTSTSTSTLTPLLSTFSSANNIASHRNSLISLTKMITTIMAVCILVMTIEQPIQCVSISSLKLPISSSSSSSSTTDSGANDGNSILTKRSIPFNGNFDNQQQQQQSDWTHPLAISQRPLEACQQIISAILTRDLAKSSSIAERLDSYWKDLKGIRYKKHNGKIVQIKSRKHRNSANSRKDSRVNKRMILFLLNLSIAKPLLEKIQSKEQLKRLEDALKMSEHIQEKKQDKSELKSMPTSSSSSSYEYHDNLHPSSLTPFDVDSLKSFEIDSNENIDVSQQSPISMEMNRNSDEDSSSLYDTNGENFYTLSPQSFPSSKTSMMTSATMKITTPVSTKTNRHPHHQHQHHHLHHHQDDTATTTGIDETASQSSRLLETDRPMLETPRSKKLLSQTMILRANPWDKEGIRFKRSSQTTEQNDNFFQPHFDQQNENTNTEPNLSILDLLHPTGIRYKKSPFDDEGIRYKKSPFDDEGIRYKKSPFDDEGIRYKKSPFDDEGIRYKKSPFDDEGIRYKKAPHMFNDEGIRY
ncbi:uncharacterized protein LOC113793778 [Dermatophagoides pteronyssinus]|uniref:Uncharacterized protein DDB_G0271670-like n=1 Tax=Dermatophagoides pteronyssinus TaxID=6956 RepID=A0A6P6Y307_DERPT|nr:uncharacterized protein DDB_G0271670-like [Dermatophagoides pteronyssinus]